MSKSAAPEKIETPSAAPSAELAAAAGPEVLVRELLLRLGEDPEREGLRRTPERVAKALAYLTSGYQADLARLLHGALFSVA